MNSAGRPGHHHWLGHPMYTHSDQQVFQNITQCSQNHSIGKMLLILFSLLSNAAKSDVHIVQLGNKLSCTKVLEISPAAAESGHTGPQ